jgi:hypothetical protein
MDKMFASLRRIDREKGKKKKKKKNYQKPHLKILFPLAGIFLCHLSNQVRNAFIHRIRAWH